jgi:antitoxin component HigA of HigAB toxin-antitoxin module
MPITYEELLAETLPSRIETEEEFDRLHARFGELFALRHRTEAEERLKQLLGVLIRDYDERTALPSEESSPAATLQFLVDHSGKTATQLLTPIFGQRSHIHEALTGKRAISAAQARKLGALFCVNPGLFL